MSSIQLICDLELIVLDMMPPSRAKLGLSPVRSGITGLGRAKDTMKWIKQGIVFEPNGNFGWMRTHAQVPTVLVMQDRLRVYFATRPQSNLGLTAFVDLDKRDPKRVLYVHDKPILELGRHGMFDNHGIFPSYVRTMNGQVYLYYLGWYHGTSIPYHNAVGLAVSEDGGVTFRKMFDGPVLDRSAREAYSVGSLWIVPGNNVLNMFYNEVFDWVLVNDKQEPLYHIKHAVSQDGIEWKKTNRVCVKPRHEREAVARPTIISREGIHHMWFCYRGSEDFRDGTDSYRIGYAWSENLLDWKREDDLSGIGVSTDGWDSKMIAYPYAVEVNGRDLMFYNGNRFGAAGFGYATAAWDDSNSAER